MTSLVSVFSFLWGQLDTFLFGNIGIMVSFLCMFVFGILMFFNATRFTAMGFFVSLLLAFGLYGYTVIGWIAVLGGLVAGVVLYVAFLYLFFK
jgi:hypothetical protein